MIPALRSVTLSDSRVVSVVLASVFLIPGVDRAPIARFDRCSDTSPIEVRARNHVLRWLHGV